MEDYNPYIDIDLNRLEEECAKQPRRIRKKAEEVADAKKEVAILKVRSDIVDAELELEIRRDPKDYGIARVSESAIKKAIILQPEHRKAELDIIDAQHKVDILQAAVNALEHKKRMLEKAVDLFGMDYFSVPYIKDSIKIERKVASREARRGTGIDRT